MKRIWCAISVLGAFGMLLLAGCRSSTMVQPPKTGVVHLLNGRNLDAFDTILTGQGTNRDPDKVFTLTDGMLRISGQHFGCLASKKEYANYKLIAEFKWGDVTWAPRQFKARESGILVNATVNGGAIPTGIECQVIEGGTGSIIVAKGASLTVDGVTKGPESGRFDRPGRSQWKDQLGFHGTNEIENARGEWNTLEIICAGGEVGIAVNGHKTLAGSNAKPNQGKILLQSKGAEVFFRKLDLYPIK